MGGYVLVDMVDYLYLYVVGGVPVVSKVVYRFTCDIPFDFGFHFVQPCVQACCGLADILFVALLARD